MRLELLKKHGPDPEQELIDALQAAEEKPEVPYDGIRCPRCGWRPTASSRWQCLQPCFHVWNTFDTRGHCPGCGYQWLQTQCLACHVMSPHEEWYERPRTES